MTQGEQNETAADPFCGFNLGSTVYRATPEKKKPPKKFIFESPVVRLISDYKYCDVYENGLDIMDEGWEGSIARRSIIVFRYYDEASLLLGQGETPPITKFASDLSDLIVRVRKLVCDREENKTTPEDFRCYLVAHSMGGLVCRAFLQNPACGDDEARRCVDKVFTYATPHNGIDMAGINVPQWLGLADMDNFNRLDMSKYLALESRFKDTHRVDWLPEEVFPSDRFFCMVGTNRADYEVALGLSRTFAGHGSDGLVRVENASVWGFTAKGEVSVPSATAYAYRSHSGHFGIVNSEEAYQNLTRFLFGDVRADIWLDIDKVRLPQAIQGKAVDALYQIELLAAPRGMRWYLTRRVAEEDSVACRTHLELTDPDDASKRKVYLSTVFLAASARVTDEDTSLSYGLTLGVRVPDYEVDRRFWIDGHYEGGYLYWGVLIVKIFPPQSGDDAWKVTYRWQSQGEDPDFPDRSLDYEVRQDGKVAMQIPFENENDPGIAGKLRFVVSAWNNWLND